MEEGDCVLLSSDVNVEESRDRYVESQDERENIIEPLNTSGMCFNEDVVTNLELPVQKYRERDVAFLDNIVQEETRMIIDNRVMEEVKTVSLKAALKEAKELRFAQENKIKDLKQINEELKRKLQNELSSCQQIEKEMRNTGNITAMVKQHVQSLEKQFESITNNKNNFKATFEKQEEIRKQTYNIAEQIEFQKGAVQKVQAERRAEQDKFAQEHRRRSNILQSLTIRVEEMKCEITTYKEKKDELTTKNEFLKSRLQEEAAKERALKCSITNFSTEDLEFRKIELERKLQEKKKNLNLSLNTASQKLQELKQRRESLENKIELDINEISRYEEKHTELKMESLELQSKLNELKCSIGDAKDSYNITHCQLSSEQKLVADNLVNLRASFDVIKQQNDTLLQKLNAEEQSKSDLLSKISELDDLKKLLADQLNDNKLQISTYEEIHTKAQSELNVTQKHLGEKTSFLSNVEEKLEKEKADAEEKINAEILLLEDAKKQYETKTQIMSDMFQMYIKDSKKINEEREQKNRTALEEIENKILDAKQQISEAKRNADNMQNEVERKTQIRDKLLERKNHLLQQNSKSKTQVKTPSKPSSILKSPKRPVTPTKKVSFDLLSSFESLSDDGIKSKATDVQNPGPSTSQSERKTSSEEMFNLLVRSSPPQRLTKRKLE